MSLARAMAAAQEAVNTMPRDETDDVEKYLGDLFTRAIEAAVSETLRCAAETVREAIRHQVVGEGLAEEIEALYTSSDATEYVVVPREPTKEMLHAGYEVLRQWYPPKDHDNAIGQYRVWEAMIAASKS